MRCVHVYVQASSGGGLGAGRLQAMLAALLSVKVISKLSRCGLSPWLACDHSPIAYA